MGGGVLSSLFKKILGSAGDDIATKVSSQYGDDVIRNLATSSADDIAAKQGNLIATHQLTADKLKGAADMGGFVQPSVAVVDPSKGTNFLPGSGFGEIVMIPNREAINPARAAAKTVIGDLDLSLAQLAKEGKRGISPYVLGLGGIVPAGGILGAMFSGNGNDQQPMA